MKRAAFLGICALIAARPAFARSASRVTVFRDRGCSCCEGWTSAIRSAGYATDLRDVDHPERLRRFGISEELAGCHTALMEGYLLEGHVPLGAIAKLQRERPKTRGITVPGMPSGTPGMPGPKAPVRVVLLDNPNRIYYTE